VSRTPAVVVLDYGSGNLRSAQRALERVGARVTLTADRNQALTADGLVVPGVGAFASCMAGLRSVDGVNVIAERLAASRPVLGICVGMQVLFGEGIEHGGTTAGCGHWPGVVERLRAPVVPHMGWNTVVPPRGSLLFDGIDPGTRFYFVHSYARMVDRKLDTLPHGVTTAEHGQQFAAALEPSPTGGPPFLPLSATQFHPEKSGDAGAEVLANWLRTLR
jgi:imidazole glycerol-phosphate synthase subunit HisH